LEDWNETASRELQSSRLLNFARNDFSKASTCVDYADEANMQHRISKGRFKLLFNGIPPDPY